MVNRIKELCKKNGTNIKKLEEELGIGNGVIARWKTSTPSAEKVLLVARRFGVSVEFLLTGEQPTVTDGLSESETRLLAAFRALEPEQQGSVLQLLQSIAAQRQAALDHRGSV